MPKRYQVDRKYLLLTLILILTVFTLSLTNPSPSSSTIEKIEIGIICPTSEDYEKYSFLSSIAEDDLNKICRESELNIKFEFNISDGKGSAKVALKITEDYHQAGVDLLVGGGWSSQLFEMQNYVNNHGMIVISPSSTSPLEVLRQDDYIFRLSPNDFDVGKIVAHVSKNHGVNNIVLLERDDAWAGGIESRFVEEYAALGCSVLGRVKYPPATSDNFSEYLHEVETIIVSNQGAKEKTGVFLMSFSETSELLKELDDYPILLNVTWFSTDALIDSLNLNTVPEASSMIKLISPMHSTIRDEHVQNISARFQDRFESRLNFYESNVYDSCMILGLSIIKVGSKDPSQIKNCITLISEDYTGLTGPCGLDNYGDRLQYITGLYAIGYDSGFKWILIGNYSSPINRVVWETK